MANFEAKLSPQEVFNNKKIFSNKIHARVLKVAEEITTSFDNLKIENDEDKRLFLDTVNHYYRNLCAVVFHLRQVLIKIVNVDQGVRDLQNVITELNKIVQVVQESLNLEIEKLKIKLKGTIVDVGSQVENLMKIIEYDNLHEYKQNVLDCQHDLVISAEALKFYCQISDANYPKLEKIIHEVLEKIKNNLIQVKTGHEVHEKDFQRFTRHYVQNLQNVFDYIRKMFNTGNVHNDIVNGFKVATLCCIESSSEILEAVSFDKPMNKMLELMESCHDKLTKSSAEIQKCIKELMEKSTKKEEIEIARQLTFHVCLNILNALNALNLSIEDAIMKK